MKTLPLDSPTIEHLRARVNGRVITPDDQDYDGARSVFYGGFDRHPLAIVKVANANDVAQVVTFASENGLELAVRSGGHSLVGYGVSEGGIVLDLADMRALEINAAEHTAWAEAGLTAGEYTAKAGAYGLATGFGDSGSVGIGGITLGGGVGYLIRKYGLTIDDLLAAEVVTADGQLLHVDANTNEDLFWAIRGGGGNFGVVTRFQFRLHEVDSILGGMLILPATPASVAAFVAEADAAPDELSAITNVMLAPPMPFVPAEYHGKPIIMAQLAYAGDVAAGQQVIARFRSLATPIVDMVRPMKYPELYPPEQQGYHPLGVSHSMFVEAIDQQRAQTILEHLATSTAMMQVAQIRVMGGAVSRVPVEATAFAHRKHRIMLTVAALYKHPDEAAVHKQWVNEVAAALAQDDASVYVNFLGDEGAERVRDAYPGSTWERLRAIKRRYDPTNLFHLNQNIPPAS